MQNKHNNKGNKKSNHKNPTVKVKETNPGWYNDKINVKYTDTSFIKNFKGSQLYGYVDPSFDDDQWYYAIEKGVAKTKYGANGVKDIPNSNGNGIKFYELKINGGARLYSNKIHKNELGDYLIIFDKEIRNKEYKPICKKIKTLEIFEDCHSECHDASGLNHGLIGDTEAVSEY
jgi:hypothetical protein